jgi:hypothetical protein
MRERRAISENAALNQSVIRVLGAVALILSAGAITLAWNRIPPPDWMGNVVNVLVGGLIGYLAKDIKQPAHPTVSAPDAQTVNVDATGGTVETPIADLPGNATPAPPSTPAPGSPEDRTRNLPPLGEREG